MIKFDDIMTPLDRVDDIEELLEGIADGHNESNSNMKPPCSEERDSLPLAMVYPPKQAWRNIYDPEEALEKGTLFKELYFPWLAGEKGRK